MHVTGALCTTTKPGCSQCISTAGAGVPGRHTVGQQKSALDLPYQRERAYKRSRPARCSPPQFRWFISILGGRGIHDCRKFLDDGAPNLRCTIQEPQLTKLGNRNNGTWLDQDFCRPDKHFPAVRMRRRADERDRATRLAS